MGFSQAMGQTFQWFSVSNPWGQTNANGKGKSITSGKGKGKSAKGAVMATVPNGKGKSAPSANGKGKGTKNGTVATVVSAKGKGKGSKNGKVATATNAKGKGKGAKNGAIAAVSSAEGKGAKGTKGKGSIPESTSRKQRISRLAADFALQVPDLMPEGAIAKENLQEIFLEFCDQAGETSSGFGQILYLLVQWGANCPAAGPRFKIVKQQPRWRWRMRCQGKGLRVRTWTLRIRSRNITCHGSLKDWPRRMFTRCRRRPGFCFSAKVCSPNWWRIGEPTCIQCFLRRNCRWTLTSPSMTCK